MTVNLCHLQHFVADWWQKLTFILLEPLSYVDYIHIERSSSLQNSFQLCAMATTEKVYGL